MSSEGTAHPTLPITAPLAPGAIGEYALLARLASGGMATVYLARKCGAAGFERLVAIKCCHPHLRDNDDFVSMFLDEARIAASIRHPNVVGTLDVSDGELLYLVMDYVEGCSLANMIRETSRVRLRVPAGIALRVMIDTLRGLHAAHELRDGTGHSLNVVHRDVSPQNILVGVDGVSRISDFGIAFASARSTQTQDGMIKGKFAYLAPEQLAGRAVTRRMDIFSAGVVLWEALTGRGLFRRADDAGTIQAVINGPIPPPSGLRPTLPAELDRVLLRALCREPAERYDSAADFADALEALGLPDAAPRNVARYVQERFGDDLARRQELIQNAFYESQTRVKVHPELAAFTASPSHRPDGPALGAPLRAPRDAAPSVPDLAYRRTRAILAALMLLLVGSALGLLLARSSNDAVHPAPDSTQTDPEVAKPVP